MKITFLLPGISTHPVGGFKIVYEYANRLSKRGHEVSIVFDTKNGLKRHNLPEFLRKILNYFIVLIFPRWFQLDKNIKKIYANNITDDSIPTGDIVIATAIQTAFDVYNLSSTKGKKVYFIQGYENWNYSDKKVKESYKLGMKNVVISRWLKEIVDKSTCKSSVYIPNGIDFDIFNIDRPIENRNPYSLSMMYHNSELKGSKYGIEVIKNIKEKYPQLQVNIFGIPKRPNNLPSWIEYTQNASEKELRFIYNNSAIFLSTSLEDGFGLTGAESMACGCVLVSTDYKGVFEYANPGKNSLISPVQDINKLTTNIIKLIENNKRRIELAEQGYRDIKKFDWNNSVELFEEMIYKL